MDDQDLLLAWAIGQWAAALMHLDALQRVEVRVPYAVIGRTSRELDDLCRLWRSRHGDPFYDTEDRAAVVTEAREHCTTHTGRLDELLTELE